jgi:hypothetical protein
MHRKRLMMQDSCMAKEVNPASRIRGMRREGGYKLKLFGAIRSQS